MVVLDSRIQVGYERSVYLVCDSNGRERVESCYEAVGQSYSGAGLSVHGEIRCTVSHERHEP